tara:strand:- start:266 stop:808 length:543 start_codon:yes stop_codon:yes gene_type:complete
MITYAKIENNQIVQWPYGQGDLKLDNPNISFSHGALATQEIRDLFNIVEVAHAEMSVTPGHKAVQVGPVKEADGSWTQKWELQAKKESELVDSDFTNSERSFEAELLDEHGVEVYTHVNGGAVWKTDHWEIDWVKEDLPYKMKRLNAYGDWKDQLEFISENGLEAWQTKVAEVKARYPKV